MMYLSSCFTRGQLLRAMNRWHLSLPTWILTSIGSFFENIHRSGPEAPVDHIVQDAEVRLIGQCQLAMLAIQSMICGVEGTQFRVPSTIRLWK